jgi:hypothetical protein
MRKICEWSKCKELASGQGLIKKDINKQYKWFCGEDANSQENLKLLQKL